MYSFFNALYFFENKKTASFPYYKEFRCSKNIFKLNYLFTASDNAFPGLNLTTFLASTVISSPV